jgi:hypothetical protein
MPNRGKWRIRLNLMIAVAFALMNRAAFSEAMKQDNSQAPGAGLRVFLDVSSYQDYIKEQIPYVSYVRDREQAQVHILMTRQGTGGSATEFTITLTGLEEFSGVNDTLTCITRDQDTEQYTRSEIVRILKLGLIRYVSRTPEARGIRITYQQRSLLAGARDGWDYWVFGIGASFNTSGQNSSTQIEYEGGITADRITSAYKFSFSIFADDLRKEYSIGQRKVTSISRQNGFKGLAVKSLGDHWSVGAYGELSSSVYYNIDMSASLEPAVEYDIFPYSQSTHRDFRVMYRIGYLFNRYKEETIYFVTEEHLYQQVLSMNLDVKENWGTIGSDLIGESYLHDFNLNKLTLRSTVSLRISNGFSSYFTGSYSAIHNQVELPRRGASDEDILLKRQQLATQYSYAASVGISYQFGSKYTNIVNPRFQ